MLTDLLDTYKEQEQYNELSSCLEGGLLKSVLSQLNFKK